MKRLITIIATAMFLAGLTGCGSNSPQLSTDNLTMSQTMAAGVYFNPTAEYIPVNLDGMTPIDGLGKQTAAKATSATTGTKQLAKATILAPGDTVSLGIDGYTKMTIAGCLEPIEVIPGSPVTVCYDNDNLKAPAEGLSSNISEMLLSIYDLLGDTGSVKIIVTSYAGGDIHGYYDGDQHIALVQYTDPFTILVETSHELGHAAFQKVRGNNLTELWLNEAVALWAQDNYISGYPIDEFDGGNLYVAPISNAGYSRLSAMVELMQELQIISPKKALQQADFIKAVTGLDEKTFSRKFFRKFQQLLPTAKYSQYIPPYCAIRITGTATSTGASKLEKL